MSRHDQKNDTAKIDIAKELYRKQAESIDSKTLTALRTARRDAVANGGIQRFSLRWLVPTASVCAAILVAVIVMPYVSPPSKLSTQNSMPIVAVVDENDSMNLAPGDEELIESDEAILDNDPDFYRWLAETPVANNTDPFPDSALELENIL